MQYKVSVIIPVFNSELYIRRCFESLHKQTLKEIEIIFVDDGSTDSSAEILKNLAELDTRVKLITQTNKGTGAARNAGIRLAKGEYIAFMDSDDSADTEMLNFLFQKAMFDKDIVVCGHQEIKPNKTVKKHLFSPDYNARDYFSDIVALVKPSAVWAKIYHRDLFLNSECFFSETIRNNEDNASLLKLLYFANSVNFVFNSLYQWFRLEGSKSQTINPIRISETIDVMNVRKGFLLDKGIFETYKLPFLRSIIRTIKVRFNNIDKFTVGSEREDLLRHFYQALCQPQLLSEQTLQYFKLAIPSEYWNLIYKALDDSIIVGRTAFISLFPKNDIALAKANYGAGKDPKLVALVKNIKKSGIRNLYIYGTGDTWLRLKACLPKSFIIKGFIDKKFAKNATKKKDEFTLEEAFSVMKEPSVIVIASISQVEQITDQILLAAKRLHRTPHVIRFFESEPCLEERDNG
ncbi:glycosyltransferase family 2 protein [Aliiglaciecola aliphaticivorans]